MTEVDRRTILKMQALILELERRIEALEKALPQRERPCQLISRN